MHRVFLTAAGVYGASGVLFGAFGAHALRDVLSPARLGVWETAVNYQLLHALALLGIGLWYLQAPRRLVAASGLCMLLGVLAFSGSLYLLAHGGPAWLGPVTPLGGTLMAAGWLCVALAAARGGA